MKKTKLNRFEIKTAGEPSPEQLKQAREIAVNMLMSVYERLPVNPAPVHESFEELARQAKFGVKRSADFTKIISGAAEKPVRVPADSTFINVGGQENSGKNESTFSPEQLETLRKIENGE